MSRWLSIKYRREPRAALFSLLILGMTAMGASFLGGTVAPLHDGTMNESWRIIHQWALDWASGWI